ncbi:MAG: FMN-binding negative transcriptional regulator [Pseudomonadota bacterium]
MYIPAHFDEPRLDALHALIRQHPFGALVTQGAQGLDANHLPFDLDAQPGEPGVLRAHVARANPLWRDVKDGDEVLAIFQAGDAYVSPNWYPSKQEQHRQVPTWNYMVVHAHGRIRVRDDEPFVRALVGRLTKTHEASQPAPWKMADSPREFIDSLLQAIVGIEIGITRLTGKVKLSQNRELRDLQGAAEALKAAGKDAVADAMLARAHAGRPR